MDLGLRISIALKKKLAKTSYTFGVHVRSFQSPGKSFESIVVRLDCFVGESCSPLDSTGRNW